MIYGVDMITVQEVIQKKLIDDELIDIIPRQCEKCGEELYLSENLVYLSCENRYCYGKVAARIEEMAKRMQVDGWGESTCNQVAKTYKVQSPYSIFLLENTENTDIPAFTKKVADICNMENREKYLWEIVQLASIPHIDTIAYKLFNGYKSIEEFFDDLDTCGVCLIADKVGVKNDIGSIMCVSIYNTLEQYKNELLFGEKQFIIKEQSGVELRVVITGPVDGFVNKTEFINFINKRYNGKVNLVQMNTVSKNTDILIVDEETNSTKYMKAQRLNNNGSNIFITNSSLLLEYMDIEYA